MLPKTQVSSEEKMSPENLATCELLQECYEYTSQIWGGVGASKNFISRVTTEFLTDFDSKTEATSVKTHLMRDFRVRLFFEWDVFGCKKDLTVLFNKKVSL